MVVMALHGGERPAGRANARSRRSGREMLSGALMLVRRDVRLSIRQGMDSLMAVVFFVLACVLFPLGVGPEPQTLSRIASGIICVAALLAAMLSLGAAVPERLRRRLARADGAVAAAARGRRARPRSRRIG